MCVRIFTTQLSLHLYLEGVWGPRFFTYRTVAVAASLSVCICEHGRQRITLPPNTCKDCGPAQWHLGSASTGGCAASAGLYPNDTAHTPDSADIGVRRPFAKGGRPHPRVSRETRMVDHPRKNGRPPSSTGQETVARGWGRDHPRVERMVDHALGRRGILIFCMRSTTTTQNRARRHKQSTPRILTRSSIYMTAHYGYIRDSLPRNQVFFIGGC